MIRSITLQNFKSFGERQEVPLEPITVLVGPNNSGKSSFMSVGRFVANAVIGGPGEAINQEGGTTFAFHRPPQGQGELELGWQSEGGNYTLRLTRRGTGVSIATENLQDAQGDNNFSRAANGRIYYQQGGNHFEGPPVDRNLLGLATIGQTESIKAIRNPLSRSRMIKLSRSALRADSAVVPAPQLTQEGAGLAAVLGLWRGSQPEKCEELEAFLRKCLPEVRNVLVRPSPVPGSQRLWIRQTDGEEFDAEHLSDGVLCFTALTMHAIDAGPGQMLFIEEPEHSIHPRRLRELVDLGAGEEDCRVCWLGQRVPDAWKAEPSTHRACIIVPVQTLETWLLSLKEHDFGDRRPEQTYDRPALKKKFYGRPIPPSRRCTELALAQLRRPDALDILRQRPSFQHFEQQLRSW